MFAQRTVLADGMSPIVAFGGAKNGIVLTIAEEIIVDGTHSGGNAQSGVQVVKRGLVAAEILVTTSLELDREQRLLRVLQGLGHFVDQQHVMDIIFPDVTGVNIGGGDHAGQVDDADQLGDADREGLAAIAEAVDIDNGRHVHAVGFGFIPQPGGVLAQVVAVEAAVVFDDAGSMGSAGMQDAVPEELVEGAGRIPVREMGGVLPRQIGSETGHGVGIGVQDVAHPLDHAHFVVQLDHDDLAAARDLARGQHAEDGFVPILDTGQEVGMEVADHVLDFAVLADKGHLRVSGEDPGRDTFVDGFGHDVGAGTGDDEEAHFGGEVEETGQVAHGMAVTVEVGLAFFELVPEPGDVGGQGVETGRLE